MTLPSFLSLVVVPVLSYPVYLNTTLRPCLGHVSFTNYHSQIHFERACVAEGAEDLFQKLSKDSVALRGMYENSAQEAFYKDCQIGAAISGGGLGTPGHGTTKLPTNNNDNPGCDPDYPQDMEWEYDQPAGAPRHEEQETTPNGSCPVVIDCPGDAMDVDDP
jgi:hypothetical protein